MRRTLSIFLLVCSVEVGRAQSNPTNEVDGAFNGTSYDTDQTEMSHPFATYFYDAYPQWTNHIYSWSRSGSSLLSDYQNQEGRRLLPLFHSFPFLAYNWNLANDNSAEDSNATASAILLIAQLPPTNYNAVAGVATNEGVSLPPAITQPMGRPPHDSSDGDSGAVVGNAGSMGAATFLGVPVVNLWSKMFTANFVSDQAGPRLLWNSILGGSHFSQSGCLAIDLFVLQALGVETNIGSFTLNFNGGSLSASSHTTVTGVSLSGNTLTATVLFGRMPTAWDVPNGTITNDARGAFVVYPELGNSFRWILQVTNLPVGNYIVGIDGSNVVTLTDTQLAAGWNMFTNYNGPLWAQRTEVLGRKRDQAGADRITLISHGGGNEGTLGVGDLVNYESHGGNNNEVYPTAFTGTNYITHMATPVSDIRQYDVAIWQAAQQTNHILTLTGPPIPRYAPFRR